MTLATMFRDRADILSPIAANARDTMRLDDPWMGDPVSEWAKEQFNIYFADGENSFANILLTQLKQHMAMRDALIATATQYGLNEELIAAGFTDVGPAT